LTLKVYLKCMVSGVEVIGREEIKNNTHRIMIFQVIIQTLKTHWMVHVKFMINAITNVGINSLVIRKLEANVFLFVTGLSMMQP